MADDDRDEQDRDAEEYEAGEERHGHDMATLDERLTRLEEMVRQALTGRTAPAAPRGGTKAAEAEDRRAEMAEALADLRKQEKAERQLAGLTTTVRKVEKAVFEKAPREFRRIEVAMGWPDRD